MSFLKTSNNGTTASTPKTSTTAGTAAFNFADKIKALRLKSEEIIRSIKKLPDPTLRVEALKAKSADAAAVAQIENLIAALRETDLLKEARAFEQAINEADAAYGSLANANFNPEAKTAISRLESTLGTLELHLKWATEDMGEIDAAITKLEAATKAAEEEQKAAKKKAPAPAADPDTDADDDDEEDDEDDEVLPSRKFDNLPPGLLSKFEAKLADFQAARATNPGLVIKDPQSGKPLGYYLRVGKKYYKLDDIEDIDEPGVAFGYMDGKKFHAVKNEMAEYIIQAIISGATGDLW